MVVCRFIGFYIVFRNVNEFDDIFVLFVSAALFMSNLKIYVVSLIGMEVWNMFSFTDEAEERRCEEACLAQRTEAPCCSQEVMRSHLRRMTRESWRKTICIFLF